MGAAATVEMMAWRIRAMMIFHQQLNIFARDIQPVVRPTMMLTMMKGRLTGFAILVSRLVIAPTTAATQGPQSIPEKIVPMTSKYIGSFSRDASCPPTKLTATHTGMVKIAIMEKSSLMLCFFRVFSLLIITFSFFVRGHFCVTCTGSPGNIG